MNRISEKNVIEIAIGETDAHGIEPSEWLENHLFMHFLETQFGVADNLCACWSGWKLSGAWLEADCDGMHIYYNVRCEKYLDGFKCEELGFSDCSVVIDTTAY